MNAVTDLLKANTELRDNMERVERDLESKDAENIQLNVENQRWNPVNGFSDQLLPTDRPQWSSVCGLKETTK